MRRIIPIIRQWWCRLWIRKDEFHRTLDLDVDYMIDIQKKIDYWTNKLTWYQRDLCRRRDFAHREDMREMDKRVK